MKPNNETWKNHASMFANGVFNLKIPDYDNNPSFTAYWFNEVMREEPALNCKLVARPISDMTDEEKQELWDRTLGDWQDDFRFNKIDCEGLIRDYVDGFLYAIEVGVYPFDQSHFETGEVLPNPKNCNINP